MNVIITGGAGYIGSHTTLALLEAGYGVTVVDNLCNSKEISLQRVQELTGKSLQFYQVDLLDREKLEYIFSLSQYSAVIHFAGLKAVGESVGIPLRYYHNNVTGTLILLEVMEKFDLRTLVFSSSATVYGDPKSVPITENFPLSATNPYGRTKLVIEDILRDLYTAEPEWNIALLRYFNPVGAHISGLIGEDPKGIPNNLFPYISQVAVGRHPFLRVFGDDYSTPDGTGVRDYIHVMDLAEGHIRALKKLQHQPGLFTYNLGTGRGYSVFEVLRAFELACGKTLPYKIMPRRSGDVPTSYADPTLANRELDWYTTRGIQDMCADTWRWQVNNPEGFR